jgi:DNA-binding winged helix-turn-helix (wHTH) protein/energy-coupling factor transporter ATP-binding protein EcfA2
MSGCRQVSFPPFTLDISNQRLQYGSEKILLRPKSLAVLAYLVEHPHRLVSREELMDAVWPGAKVVDAALRVSIQEIRKALGGCATHPKFIETVGKKGYRFIAPVSLQIADPTGVDFATFVGRESELELLRHHFAAAQSGKRQMVFVTGEAGIGKTTLVEAFANGLPQNHGIIIAQGQCIEQYGSGEAYLPILDALEQISGDSRKEQALDLLRRYAPSWLVNLPGVIDAAERAEIERSSFGITREQRFREIAAFLEAIAQEQSLLLVLEDLHWLDPSSLALISFLAERQEPAQLMLIGTSRENEVADLSQPLQPLKEDHELCGLCSYIPLKFLSCGAVGEYLAARFATPLVSDQLSAVIYARSEGNPLFMVNITDDLLAAEAIARRNGMVALDQQGANPVALATLRELIERHFERLAPADRELLETASVDGMTFSAPAVAAALETRLEEVERRCRQLCQRAQFLQAGGTTQWPDGTTSSEYGFIHELYQNAIYERIDNARKIRLHRSIGERLEAGYQDLTQEIAAMLAAHFERAGAEDRAVKYLLEAAQKSLSVCAYSETIEHANKALHLLGRAKPRDTGNELALSFQLLLGLAYAGAKGFSAAEARDAFSKADTLSPVVKNNMLAFRSLFGLWIFHTVHNDLPLARQIVRRMIDVARRSRSIDLQTITTMSAGITAFYMGDFAAARTELERGSALGCSQDTAAATAICGWNPLLSISTYKGQALLFLGYPDRAAEEIETAISLSRANGTPYDQALSFGLTATYFTYALDPQKSLEFCEKTLSIANGRGFSHWAALATILKGSALCELGDIEAGIKLIHDGIAQWKATGAKRAKPVFYGFEARSWLIAKNPARARAALEVGLALSHDTQDCYYDAELWRLYGEACADWTTQEKYFQSAITLARRQKAKLLELRAMTSLCRLWQRQGHTKQAQRSLTKLYARFNEAFDAPDLKSARAFLKELN